MKIAPLRSGLIGLFSQNLILMGVFFTIPLYLQLVIGLDALETGLKMLPVSITMFLASAAGSRLSGRYPRPLDRPRRAGDQHGGGRSCCWPRSSRSSTTRASRWSMAVLGVGMGLIASQLGNVVQSSVDASGRGEAGGLQFTGQQLGSSLGVALIGAIVLSGLTATFADQHLRGRTDQQRRRPSRSGWPSGPGSTSCPPTRSRRLPRRPGSTSATTEAIVDDYESAQLQALKAGLLAAAFLALVSLAFTKNLPHEVPAAAEASSSL